MASQNIAIKNNTRCFNISFAVVFGVLVLGYKITNMKQNKQNFMWITVWIQIRTRIWFIDGWESIFMSDLKVVSTSYMQLAFKNSINFLCLKECIKQFVHSCNWELGAVSSLEVKIIKEPLRRQLLETKLFFIF